MILPVDFIPLLSWPNLEPFPFSPGRPSSRKYSRLSATIILSIIISIRSWRPFSLSACLHNTSETAAQAECRVKLASTMLRRSRQSQFHLNLFLCEIHKSSILLYLLFLFYKSKEIRRLSFYLNSDTRFETVSQYFHYFRGFHTFHYDLLLNLTINRKKFRNFNFYF